MKRRPCACDRCDIGQPYVPGQCRLCWNFHNTSAYREAWGGGPLPGSRGACTHRGAEVGRELCVTCKGKVEVKVFSCAVHGRCALVRALPGVINCATCADFRPSPVVELRTARRAGKPRISLGKQPSMNKHPGWVVGLTTVPARREELLPRTLASLQAAGFPSPRLFVDGCPAADAQGYGAEFGCEVTAREPRLRAFGNFILGIAELYIRNPVAERYLMVQDDVLFLRNLRSYLDSQSFPKAGYWNLYTAFENDGVIAPLLAQGRSGWVEGATIRNKHGQPHPRGLQRGLGALALVFSREGVQRLLSFAGIAAKPAHAERGYRLIDGAVVTAMNEQVPSWREWVHCPTLCHHLGDLNTGHRSTIERPTGQPQYPPAHSWRGADFDALSLPQGAGVGPEVPSC